MGRRRQLRRPFVILAVALGLSSRHIVTSFTGASRGSLPLPGALEGRAPNVHLSAFNLFKKLFGGRSPQDLAQAELAKLASAAALAREADLKALKSARESAKAARDALETFQAELQAEREKATAASQDWVEDKWDASLEEAMKPVLAKATAAKAASASLEKAAQDLATSCKSLVDHAKNRSSTAEAAVESLTDEVKQNLAPQVAKAAQGLEGKLLRFWVLGKAEASSARYAAQRLSEASREAEELPKELRSSRAKKAEAAKPEEPKKKLEPKEEAKQETKEPEEGEGSAAFILALIAAAVIAAVVYVKGAPAPPAATPVATPVAVRTSTPASTPPPAPAPPKLTPAPAPTPPKVTPAPAPTPPKLVSPSPNDAPKNVVSEKKGVFGGNQKALRDLGISGA